MEKRVAITTIDNPYDPITDFSSWYRFDLEKGYGTAEYFARICKEISGLPEKIQNIEIENAIDEIIQMNVGPIPYRKVVHTH